MSVCRRMLRAGGLLVVVTRNALRSGRLLDRVGDTVTRARDDGLVYLQHIVAVHPPVRDGARLRWAPAAGLPVHRPVHSDLLVFTTPTGGRRA